MGRYRKAFKRAESIEKGRNYIRKSYVNMEKKNEMNWIEWSGEFAERKNY